MATAGCGKAPPAAVPTLPPAPPPAVLTIAAAPEATVKAPMTLSASADVNPNATGRPSPVVVRVYQLRTDTKFVSSDFEPLYADDERVLGQERISMNEFVLRPGESTPSIDVTVSGETRFVGVIAAFRDIRNAQWRGVVRAPRNGLTIVVERARVVVTAVP
jgi:type VI secretion system protein VasD